jgi:hypothetical protein
MLRRIGPYVIDVIARSVTMPTTLQSCFVRTTRTGILLISKAYLDLCFWRKFYVRPALRCLYRILGRIRFQLTLRIPSRPVSALDVSTSVTMANAKLRNKTHLKNVYDRTMSSRFRHAGSSSTSLSMKNSRGMSTSSPASSFCSSKQKHSTLAKYGAIYNNDENTSVHSSLFFRPHVVKTAHSLDLG